MASGKSETTDRTISHRASHKAPRIESRQSRSIKPSAASIIVVPADYDKASLAAFGLLNSHSQKIRPLAKAVIDYKKKVAEGSFGFETLKCQLHRPCYSIPLRVFGGQFSSLESIISYLKDEKGLRFCEIAEALGRDERSIWWSYDQLRKKEAKNPKRLSVVPVTEESGQILIPTSIFTDARLSVLESLTLFLLSTGLKPSKIGRVLGRAPTTISTVLSRVKKKSLSAKASDVNSIIPNNVEPAIEPDSSIGAIVRSSREVIRQSRINGKKVKSSDLITSLASYSVPSSVFSSSLAPLESVSRYLHDESDLSISEISRILNRDETTIWTTLANSRREEKDISQLPLAKPAEHILFPVTLFSDRRYSILESAALGLRYLGNDERKIARCLYRDPSTVRTVLRRASKKASMIVHKKMPRNGVLGVNGK